MCGVRRRMAGPKITIPQLDGGGYEKDDDYKTPEESGTSSASDEYTEEEDEDDSGSEDVDAQSEVSSATRVSLRERKPKDRKEGSVNLEAKRMTRQRDKKSEKASCSGDSKEPVQNGGRRRGRRPKSEKKEESTVVGLAEDVDDGKLFCTSCKKLFPSKLALNNHTYWCASKRITRSRGTASQKQDTKRKNNENKKQKPGQKKRGPKPKQKQRVEQDNVMLEDSNQIVDAEGEGNAEGQIAEGNETFKITKHGLLAQYPDPDWAESTEESDYEAKLNSELLPVTIGSGYPEDGIVKVDSEEDEENEIPVSCQNCRMTYRNVASLKKHLETCMYASSSCSSDEENPDGEPNSQIDGLQVYTATGEEDRSDPTNSSLYEVSDISLIPTAQSVVNSVSLGLFENVPHSKHFDGIQQIEQIHHSQQSSLGTSQPILQNFMSTPTLSLESDNFGKNVDVNSKSELNLGLESHRDHSSIVLSAQPEIPYRQPMVYTQQTDPSHNNGFLKQALSASTISLSPSSISSPYIQPFPTQGIVAGAQNNVQFQQSPQICSTQRNHSSSSANAPYQISSLVSDSSAHLKKMEHAEASKPINYYVQPNAPMKSNTSVPQSDQAIELQTMLNPMVRARATSQHVSDSQYLLPQVMHNEKQQLPQQRSSYLGVGVENTAQEIQSQQAMQSGGMSLAKQPHSQLEPIQQNIMMEKAENSIQVQAPSSHPGSQQQPQAYQIVTVQAENGQIYRVNIPLPRTEDPAPSMTAPDANTPDSHLQSKAHGSWQHQLQQQTHLNSETLQSHQHQLTQGYQNSTSSPRSISSATTNMIQQPEMISRNIPMQSQMQHHTVHAGQQPDILANSSGEMTIQSQGSPQTSQHPLMHQSTAHIQQTTAERSSPSHAALQPFQFQQHLHRPSIAPTPNLYFHNQPGIYDQSWRPSSPHPQMPQTLTQMQYQNHPHAMSPQTHPVQLQGMSQHHQHAANQQFQIQHHLQAQQQLQLQQQLQIQQQLQAHHQSQQQEQHQILNVPGSSKYTSGFQPSPVIQYQSQSSGVHAAQSQGLQQYMTGSSGVTSFPTHQLPGNPSLQHQAHQTYSSGAQGMLPSIQSQLVKLQQGQMGHDSTSQVHSHGQPKPIHDNSIVMSHQTRAACPQVSDQADFERRLNISQGLTMPGVEQDMRQQNSLTSHVPAETQMNVPYQIVQGADGTTYIIVQPTSTTNPLSSAQPEGIMQSAFTPNVADLVKSALLAQHANSSTNSYNPNNPQGSSFSIGNQCIAQLSGIQACPCTRCALLRATSMGAAAPEKYRKVLPSPRPIEPKVQTSESLTSPKVPTTTPMCVKTYMRRNVTANKTVKTQLANMILGKQGGNTETTSDVESVLPQSEGIDDQSLNPDVGTSQNLRKNPVLTAVVRPMEHPLQKMSDQISQIESTFSATPPLAANRPDQPSVDSLENSRKEPQHAVSTVEITNTQDSEVGAAGIDRSSEQVATASNTSEGSSTPGTPTRTLVKRKAEASSSASPAKSIKVTLKRKEGGDSYSINDVSETGASSTGTMRSLKIKAKITSGEFAGTSTDVVVEPKIHIVPIPDPDADDLDSNLTIAENDSPIVGPIVSATATPTEILDSNGTASSKLTHRAVVVYEVKCNNTILFRSSNVRAVWSHIFETVQGTRLNHNLPPLSYPATNISLENRQTPTTNFNVGGLIHRAVQFLLQHLPKTKSDTDKHPFRFHEPPALTNGNDDNLEANETGCARTEGFAGRKPFDMFGWLASKHRRPLEKIQTSDAEWKNNGLPIAIRFRTMKEKTRNTLTVMWSTIHGRGLYTRRSIEKGELIIEYAGEVIRSLVCDQREKYYETKSIGCYMFRIDDEYVIDATMKGNAARFINHSCEPNCESKSMKILGKDRIMIFALRKITSGEELTYDYKFEKEEDKIPCTCSSSKCRKYLN